ncbi:YisL family protein [Sporosarcina aquimarina]|uniref:YisL family protein n=1 Tax=Sporosarcina aquimarina TaxID=114975 RepID=UPI00203CE8E9|nr:YisL family protein [Sporosarcina aquimarina]MCM3756472.1 YisL family protein [Sporosarcina aquimarina]
MDFLSNSTHLHIFSWVVGIIMFLIAATQPLDSKGRKITKMVLRVFYILIIITGVALFIRYMNINAALYGVKFVFGIVTIGMMEMVLARQSKSKPTQLFWILFVVSVLITMFLGFKLPIGLDFFA